VCKYGSRRFLPWHCEQPFLEYAIFLGEDDQEGGSCFLLFLLVLYSGMTREASCFKYYVVSVNNNRQLKACFDFK
jgi:hypothetical protein